MSTLNRSPVNIEIEPMTLQHLDRVLEIEALSYSTPWSKRAFVSEVTDNSYAHYYVARKDGIIVGYVGMWVILEEAHITNIAVRLITGGWGSARPCLRPCSVKQERKARLA